MSDQITTSNLKNQICCTARSKRTHQPCKQPRMKGKQVCRFHGGRSTGPRTKEGRQRIREVHLIHGRYSKVTKEHEAASKRLKQEKELWQIQERTLDKHVARAKALRIYFQALNKANSWEEYGLLRMFLFGGLNNLITSNALLRTHLKDMFALLFENDAFSQFEALTAKLEQYHCAKLNIPTSIWQKLTPGQRHEEYIQQLSMRLMEVWPDLSMAARTSLFKEAGSR